jgi:NEDD8-activating enzyme E1
MKRVKGVSITPHNCKIQDKDADFYEQFAMYICGLDSIEARRWINTHLVEAHAEKIDEQGEDFAEYKPLIDGGTEGLCTLRFSYSTY